MIRLGAPMGKVLLEEQAFDLIDHNTLIMKLCMTEVPNSIIN